MDESKLGLPFKLWPTQLDAIDKVIKGFESGTKVALLQGPTGSGKSAIATAVARYRQSLKTVVLTRTKDLQRQYADQLGYFSAEGKASFDCPALPPLTADLVECQLVTCNKTECQYFINKGWSKIVRELATNYYWFLANDWLENVEVLILDEAHLANPTVIDYMGIRLTRWELAQAKVSINDSLGVIFTKGPMNIANDLARIQRVNEPALMEHLSKLLQIRKKMITGKMVYDTSAYYEYRNNDVLVVQPEDDSGILEKALFDRCAGKVLLMSATILDPKVFMEEKGLGHIPYQYVELETNIDANRRPIFYQPAAWISAKSNDRDYIKLVEKIEIILDAHQGQRGLIHTANFRLAKKIRDLTSARNRARLLVQEGSAGRGRLFRAFLTGSAPDAVLVSPSATTGLDLAEDRGRFIIFAKVPFPDRGDSRVKRKEETVGNYYAWATVQELVQGSGRCTRSSNDFSIVYIIDETFGWFYKGNSRLFPDWWKKSLVL